jgi:transketolase
MNGDEQIAFLQSKAKSLRRQVLEIAYKIRGGHLGGTFSVLDILVALYYGGILRGVTTEKSPNRDRLFIGKGHASLAVYSILSDLGFFDRRMIYDECCVNGGSLGTQLNITTPGVEYNTGSLGNVVGIAVGTALAAKLSKKDYLSYAIIGDGECEEGSVWESLKFASDHNLDNLIVIIDCNNLSVIGEVEDDLLEDKVVAFGCNFARVDGHSPISLLLSIDSFGRGEKEYGYVEKPSVIVADTIKGKGVSFMEGNPKWHNSVMSEIEYVQAVKELEG